MTTQIVREAWFRYIRMSDEEKKDFEELTTLRRDQDLLAHLDPDHYFTLELGGEG